MANNSKFDAQMDRMQYLMGYRIPTNESKSSNKVECHRLGADNKVYGILKEGSMYYIMTTEQGKENLAESYSYINGYNYRNENGYRSYNEATKQLELKLMSLNEACGKHEDVLASNVKRGDKVLATLTEEARKELNRVHQIFENSQTIGMNNVGDPESKGKATDPAKQGDPFEEPAKAELDKDLKAEASVEDATDNSEVEGVEKDLESDAMKTKKVDPAEEGKDAHDDLEGEGVADQHPTGAKAVMVNEDFNPDDFHADDIDAKADELVGDEELSDENLEDFASSDDEELPIENGDPFGEEPEEDLDELIREFEETEKAMHGEEKEVESKIEGPDKVMDGPHGGLEAQSWDKMDEAIDRITEEVCNKLCACEGKECETGVCPKCGKKECTCKKVEPLQEAIDRIVAEEITKLDAWGKHPRYRKQPMSTPANKEVLAGSAEKDWNDDSAKGEQPYGQKIGKGDPYEKVVDLILGEVKARLAEGKKSKKA